MCLVSCLDRSVSHIAHCYSQVTKEDASEGCTRYAQGGVSAVLAETDNVEDHIRDTMVAGDFLNIKE